MRLLMSLASDVLLIEPFNSFEWELCSMFLYPLMYTINLLPLQLVRSDTHSNAMLVTLSILHIMAMQTASHWPL